MKKILFLHKKEFSGFDQASSHVQWMVIRNNSSFLQKRKLGTFTTVCQLLIYLYFISILFI
jgi:hypothetical protein